MKKLFIFALFTSILLTIGCKEGKPDYTYGCVVGYQKPDPDSKYKSWSVYYDVHLSKAVTKRSAKFEALDVYSDEHPEVKIKQLKALCQVYSDDFHEVNLLILSGFLRSDFSDSQKDALPNTKPKSKKNSFHAKYGCRAWVKTEGGSRNSMYRTSHAHTHDAAVAEMRYMYNIAYPSKTNFESNCWECDLPRLDDDGQTVCGKRP
jgi:hypothetical protein